MARPAGRRPAGARRCACSRCWTRRGRQGRPAGLGRAGERPRRASPATSPAPPPAAGASRRASRSASCPRPAARVRGGGVRGAWVSGDAWAWLKARIVSGCCGQLRRHASGRAPLVGGGQQGHSALWDACCLVAHRMHSIWPSPAVTRTPQVAPPPARRGKHPCTLRSFVYGCIQLRLRMQRWRSPCRLPCRIPHRVGLG